jgi:hypothetical protein
MTFTFCYLVETPFAIWFMMLICLWIERLPLVIDTPSLRVRLLACMYILSSSPYLLHGSLCIDRIVAHWSIACLAHSGREIGCERDRSETFLMWISPDLSAPVEGV